MISLSLAKYLCVNVVQIIKAMENCGLVNILPPSFLSSNLKENGILGTKHIKKPLSLVLSLFLSSLSMPRSQGTEIAVILSWTEVNENLPK